MDLHENIGGGLKVSSTLTLKGERGSAVLDPFASPLLDLTTCTVLTQTILHANVPLLDRHYSQARSSVHVSFFSSRPYVTCPTPYTVCHLLWCLSIPTREYRVPTALLHALQPIAPHHQRRGRGAEPAEREWLLCNRPRQQPRDHRVFGDADDVAAVRPVWALLVCVGVGQCRGARERLG